MAVDLRSMVSLLLPERWIQLADESDGGTQGCMVGAWNCEALDLQMESEKIKKLVGTWDRTQVLSLTKGCLCQLGYAH